jgi:hypothetical protein
MGTYWDMIFLGIHKSQLREKNTWSGRHFCAPARTNHWNMCCFGINCVKFPSTIPWYSRQIFGIMVKFHKFPYPQHIFTLVYTQLYNSPMIFCSKRSQVASAEFEQRLKERQRSFFSSWNNDFNMENSWNMGYSMGIEWGIVMTFSCCNRGIVWL